MIFNFFPVNKHIQVVGPTYTPFASMFPLHSCIVFLCQLLFFPQWNFFLPAFLNQLFLDFELRFILCTLACSNELLQEADRKPRDLPEGEGSISWVGEVLGTWAAVPCVWEIPTPVKGPVWPCTDQRQNYQQFLWLPCGPQHGSVFGFCSCGSV